MSAAEGVHGAGDGEVEGDRAESGPVVITTRNVSPTELAAVTAVIRGLLAEEGDSQREEPAPAPSAWQRSQRSMRGPFTPGSGRWNG